jgi:hypothetical protein
MLTLRPKDFDVMVDGEHVSRKLTQCFWARWRVNVVSISLHSFSRF